LPAWMAVGCGAAASLGQDQRGDVDSHLRITSLAWKRMTAFGEACRQSIGQLVLSFVSVVGAGCSEEISLSAGRTQQSTSAWCRKAPLTRWTRVALSGSRAVA
jgi:hypothetical protein